MVVVPPFLLKRLYVKQSLRNNSEGFQFELNNTLGSGYGTEVLPLILDGRELSRDSSYFVTDNEEVSFSLVSKDRPFTLPMNKKIAILVKGVTLSPGAHKITFNFIARGLGRLGFDFTDMVA